MKIIVLYSTMLFLSYSVMGYNINTSLLNISLSDNGEITSITVNGKDFVKPVHAFTTIAECSQQGATTVNQLSDGTIIFQRTLVHQSSQNSCVLIDKFIPVATGVRWELSVKGNGGPWSSEIQTHIKYPAGNGTLFWTVWGYPQYDPS